MYHPVAEAALVRLYGRGCGTDRLPAERVASLRPAVPPFCAEYVLPQQDGAHSLCVADIDASAIVLYRDDGQLTDGTLQRLERLRRLHERFSARGVEFLHVSDDATYRPGNGEAAYRQRDRVVEAIAEHDFPFTMLISKPSGWPDLFDTRRRGRAHLYLIDRQGQLRLRMARAWHDTTADRQDSIVVGLLLELVGTEPVRVAAAGDTGER